MEKNSSEDSRRSPCREDEFASDTWPWCQICLPCIGSRTSRFLHCSRWEWARIHFFFLLVHASTKFRGLSMSPPLASSLLVDLRRPHPEELVCAFAKSPSCLQHTPLQCPSWVPRRQTLLHHHRRANWEARCRCRTRIHSEFLPRSTHTPCTRRWALSRACLRKDLLCLFLWSERGTSSWAICTQQSGKILWCCGSFSGRGRRQIPCIGHHRMWIPTWNLENWASLWPPSIFHPHFCGILLLQVQQTKC